MDPLADTSRTRFLDRLFRDEEAGNLRPLADYVQQFSNIEPFVREEYEAVLRRVEPQHDASARYQPIELLARGGMGQVTLALDTLLGRKVAMKSLRGSAHDVRSVERLRREARVLGRLDHPAICRILDVVEVDGAPTLVLPFHVGETLAERVQQARQDPRTGWIELGSSDPTVPRNLQGLPNLLEFLARVADAVDAAHQAGVIHRDLKPGNLMVGPDGQPIVLDFGLALEVGEENQRLTMAGEQLGTPHYMAPEQIEGRACDARTDVYALGLVLYELLTLERPFAGATREATFRLVLDGAMVLPRARNAAIQRDLEAVCLRACERDPARRYESASAFADDMRRIVQLRPTLARPASGVRRVAQIVRRHRWRAAAIVAMVALGSLALLLWVSSRERERELQLVRERLGDGVTGELAALEDDRRSRRTTPQQVGSRPEILSPRGELIDPPSAVRFAAACVKPWVLTLRCDDLGRPRRVVCEAGRATIDLKDLPAGTYRLYLANEATPIASQADAVFTILGRGRGKFAALTDQVSPGDERALAVARDLLRDGFPEACLSSLGKVTPDRLADDWLRLLHCTLRLRCLVKLGIEGSELEEAQTAQRHWAESGRIARWRVLIDRAHLWREGGEWSESKTAVDELETLFPIDSPLGLWTRMTVARIRLTASFEPEAALSLMNDVVAKAAIPIEWDEEARDRLVTLNFPEQRWRDQAAAPKDTLAQALQLRGFVLNQLQRHEEAIIDLECALTLFTETECVHRIANCHQELAEAKLMRGDRDWSVHANLAHDLFDKGWGVSSASDIQRDETGIASIKRTKATGHRRDGRYAEAEDGYRRFLEHWTKSADPLTVPETNLVNLDYHLTAVWLAECLLMQEGGEKQEEGKRWVARLEGDQQQFRFQHTGFVIRLALVRAIAMWRKGEKDAAISYLSKTMDDPLVQGHRHDLEDMEALAKRIGK